MFKPYIPTQTPEKDCNHWTDSLLCMWPDILSGDLQA